MEAEEGILVRETGSQMTDSSARTLSAILRHHSK
jgi:hypothetical protein